MPRDIAARAEEFLRRPLISESDSSEYSDPAKLHPDHIRAIRDAIAAVNEHAYSRGSDDEVEGSLGPSIYTSELQGKRDIHLARLKHIFGQDFTP